MYLGKIENFQERMGAYVGCDTIYPIVFCTSPRGRLLRFYKGKMFADLAIGSDTVPIKLGVNVGTLTDSNNVIIEEMFRLEEEVSFSKTSSKQIPYKSQVLYQYFYGDGYAFAVQYFFWLDRMGRVFFEAFPSNDKWNLVISKFIREL